MWDLSREVKWWEEWQLRILVLGSLFLQFVLFVGSMTRHVRALKSCMWLAYIGADAVAIYGLTTLFNRHKTPAGDDDYSTLLEVVWAPVFLLHLGGHHTFTAYSLEDNELWGRHLVTLASQVTVALYVFCKSWPGPPGCSGDRKLLVVASLLFVAGILKFIQKPRALRAASIQSLLTSSSVYPQRRSHRMPHILYTFCLKSTFAVAAINDAAELRDEDDHDLVLEEYVHKARDLALETKVDHNYKLTHVGIFGTVKKFVDLSDPYSCRLRDLSSFLKLDHRRVAVGLRLLLGSAFLHIYTDAATVYGNIPGILLKLLLPFITLSSAVLFGYSCKDGYREEDVKVTKILLWCTAFQSFLPFILCPCVWGNIIWFTTAAQHNLISFSTRQSNPTMLMKQSHIMGFKDYVNKHWYITHKPSYVCDEVLYLVHQHVKDGWKQYIVDGASYRRFNNLRGQWAMSRHKVPDSRLTWSLKVSFDHSILVWHVATQLCLHHPSTTADAYSSEESTSRQHSNVISNYMIYLLLIRPEMLMPGTRQALFTNTSDDIEFMLKHIDNNNDDDDNTSSLPDGRSIARRILRAAKSPSLDGSKVGPWILKACKLAEDLMELLGDNERWFFIQGVWVEMLCYSAGRCRGYLHAKAMGEGVEFLTYVWFLLSSMGMETFADKFQRPDPTEGEETEIYIDAGDSSASQPQDRAAAEQAITIAVE